jgi:hypothetical protein
MAETSACRRSDFRIGAAPLSDHSFGGLRKLVAVVPEAEYWPSIRGVMAVMTGRCAQDGISAVREPLTARNAHRANREAASE